MLPHNLPQRLGKLSCSRRHVVSQAPAGGPVAAPQRRRLGNPEATVAGRLEADPVARSDPQLLSPPPRHCDLALAAEFGTFHALGFLKK